MALDKDPAMLVQKGGGENTSCWNKGGLRRKQEHDFIKTQINYVPKLTNNSVRGYDSLYVLRLSLAHPIQAFEKHMLFNI